MDNAAALAEAPGSEILGFVDATAGETLYGWAWDSKAPDARVTIHFRIGDEEIGTTTADQERDDLKANGIGDGRHAFIFRVPVEARAELDRIEILARATASGAMIRLFPPKPHEGGAAAAGASLQDVLRRVVHSQRLLHRNLQSGFAELNDRVARAGADEAHAAQEALHEQMRGVEAAIVRLDGAVHELAVAVKGARERLSDGATLAVLVALSVISAASLAFEIFRFLV
jgi:hypothetical protein